MAQIMTFAVDHINGRAAERVLFLFLAEHALHEHLFLLCAAQPEDVQKDEDQQETGRDVKHQNANGLLLKAGCPVADDVNEERGHARKRHQRSVPHFHRIALPEAVAKRIPDDHTDQRHEDQLQRLCGGIVQHQHDLNNPVEAVHHMLQCMRHTAVKHGLPQIHPEAAENKDAREQKHDQKPKGKPAPYKMPVEKTAFHKKRKCTVGSRQREKPREKVFPALHSVAEQQFDQKYLDMEIIDKPHHMPIPPSSAAIRFMHSFRRRREIGIRVP